MNGIKSNYFLATGIGLIIISLLITVAACSSSTTTAPASSSASAPVSSSATTPAASTAVGKAVTINLVAQNMAFDQSTLKVAPGASVTMNFSNKDSAPHNFALYTDSSASQSIFVGKTVSSSSIVYTFTAPSAPRNYFFRCDVHPRSMTGTFVVQ
jgi:plastocyanin